MTTINVLNVTTLVPIKEIKYKADENDILFLYASKAMEFDLPERYSFIFTLPYSNFILGLLKPKWREYRCVGRMRKIVVLNCEVFPFPIIAAPMLFRCKELLLRLTLVFFGKRLRRIVGEVKPMVLHAHSVYFDAYLAKVIASFIGIPYVVTVRELPDYFDPLVQKNLESASKLICLNTPTANLVSRLYSLPSEILIHGIEENFFTKEDGRNCDDVLRFVTVCRLLPLKNIDRVVRALESVDFEFMFDIIGEGPESQLIKDTIADCGLDDKVNMLGRVDHEHLPSILPTYDCFIMPSYPEALGRVYFEAMASKVVVVGVAGTGIDGFIKDGEEGFILSSVETMTIKIMLDRIHENRHNLKKMKEKAQQTAMEYSWEKVCNSLHDIYSDSVNGRI